jgi:hypothetical protein
VIRVLFNGRPRGRSRVVIGVLFNSRPSGRSRVVTRVLFNGRFDTDDIHRYIWAL